MKRIKALALIVLMVLVTGIGLYLTENAGYTANKGDKLFYNRYFTTSKTPISDLNTLTGSSASGTSGQIRVHDGTDFESVSMSGDTTISSSGVVTIGTGAVTSAKILDNTVASADILNATITSTDIATNTVTGGNILNGTITGTDMATNTVTLSEIFINTVTVELWAGQTSNTASVTSGSTILGYYGFANIDDIGAEMANKISISGTTLTLAVNGTVAGDQIQYKVVVLEP